MRLFVVLALVCVVTGPHVYAQPAFDRLTIVAPAAPGGGWDQLARTLRRELLAEQIAAVVQVENVPGAGGTIGLAHFIDTRRGDGKVLLVTGLVMLGAILWNESPVSITQVTPIARLTGEYEVVAVPATSPHRDMQSLVRALRDNPAGVSWGGGSAGGTDHILAGLIVDAAGVDPRRTNYIAFSGGGEAVTALLGSQVTAGISGYSEFAQHIESGRLRVLGISAPDRSTAPGIPTLREQGLDVELENWRAVVAPPDLDPSDRRALSTLVERMARSASWRTSLNELGWTDSYLAGSDFETFLNTERVRVSRIVTRLRGSAREANAGRSGEWVFPSSILIAAAVVLILLLLRGQVPTEAAPANRPAIMRLILGLVLFALLLNGLGFIAAGTILFACTSSAFGSRRLLRDVAMGFALCAIVHVVFTYGLDVPMASGVFSLWKR
jgi:putative tricarboxylic transport membrane protein